MLITNPALLATLCPGNRSRDSCDPIGVVPHQQVGTRFRFDSPVETLGHSLKFFVLVE